MPGRLDDSVIDLLKEKADTYLRSDIQRSLATARLLIEASEVTGKPSHRAVGLLAEANARAIGLGEHPRALELYQEASEIYLRQELELEHAKAQVGKIWAARQPWTLRRGAGDGRVGRQGSRISRVSGVRWPR